MDTLNALRDLIENLLSEYACLSYANGDIAHEAVFDRGRDRYVLFRIGWDGWRRVYSSFLHLDIINGKVWIQQDGTQEGIANALRDGGVPDHQIVLAFHHPSRRKDTEFAAA